MSQGRKAKECEQIREQAMAVSLAMRAFTQMMLKWLIAALIIYGGFVALLYLAQRFVSVVGGGHNDLGARAVSAAKRFITEK
jgi:hypothetical protein